MAVEYVGDYEESDNDFIEAVCEAVRESLLAEIEEKWKENASSIGSFPDFSCKEEVELFRDMLADYEIEDLKAILAALREQRFGCLVELANEPMREALIPVIEDEWSNLHHNASLLGSFPSFENDEEAALFWEVLGDYAYNGLKILQDEIYEKFALTWNLYQYGRTGATIAPDELMAPTCCNGFGGLNREKLDYYDAVDLQNILAALQYLNKRVRDFCEHIDEWWKDMK